MKSTFVLIAALLVAGAANAQKLSADKVPAAATSAFKKAFPTAKEVKWEKEDANYEAGFDMGKSEMSVVYTPAGELLETETELSVDALPAAVKKALVEKYKGQKVKEATKIVYAKTGETVYEAELKIDGKETDVLFTPEGKVKAHKAEKEHEKEDKD